MLSLKKIECRGAEPRENPIDVAHRLAGMLDQKVAATRAELARILGVSRARVSQYLGLLRLDEQLQREVRAQGPTMGRRGITEKQRVLPASVRGAEFVTPRCA
jgi:ParB-like chromosome segregation protein Spo0J